MTQMQQERATSVARSWQLPLPSAGRCFNLNDPIQRRQMLLIYHAARATLSHNESVYRRSCLDAGPTSRIALANRQLVDAARRCVAEHEERYPEIAALYERGKRATG